MENIQLARGKCAHGGMHSGKPAGIPQRRLVLSVWFLHVGTGLSDVCKCCGWAMAPLEAKKTTAFLEAEGLTLTLPRSLLQPSSPPPNSHSIRGDITQAKAVCTLPGIWS